MRRTKGITRCMILVLAVLMIAVALPTTALAVHGTILSEGCGAPPNGTGTMVVGQVYTCNYSIGNFNLPLVGDTLGDTQTVTALKQTIHAAVNECFLEPNSFQTVCPGDNILPFLLIGATSGGATCQDASNANTTGGTGALGSGTAPIAKCTLPGSAIQNQGSSIAFQPFGFYPVQATDLHLLPNNSLGVDDQLAETWQDLCTSGAGDCPNGDQIATTGSQATVVSPCLHVVKTCDDALSCTGTIGFSAAISNCGTEDLTNVTLSDALTNGSSPSAITCTQGGNPVVLPANLAAGAANIICTGTYTGVAGQPSTDTVTVTAEGAINGAVISPDATSDLDATCSTPGCPASLIISKTCVDTDTCLSTADFTVVVTNDCVSTPNNPCQTINNITVSDTNANCTLNPSGTGFNLAEGQSRTMTCSVTPASTPATISNTATASGTTAVTNVTINATPSPTNVASCDIPGCPAHLKISKTCVDTDTCLSTADFTVVVTNDCVSTPTAPCQTINNITVSDTNANCTLNPSGTGFNLAEGQSRTMTCSVTPASTPATISNTATASGTTAVTNVTISADPDAVIGNTASCDIPGCPCQIGITKTVAVDDGSNGGTACDGVADGPFGESVTVDQTACVVYNICVKNTCIGTDCQTINTTGVTITDPHLGISTPVDFATSLAPGAEVCKKVASELAAPACPNGVCVCQAVEGENVAIITPENAICEVDSSQACGHAGSVCSDTASVACTVPVTGCRMTGGHVNMAVDAEFDGLNGQKYTTGGQIGAPSNRGCCDFPQKGKCVTGICSGGARGNLECASNEDCPPNTGSDATCPWGDWEHNHHAGPDDTGSVTDGSFAFHSGTAAAPDSAFISSIICADPGWCVQARPAPDKQIFWEGTGVFHNVKGKDHRDVVLPLFGACADQPVPWSNKVHGTLHYYRAHVGDFGEPAGVRQKDPANCEWSNTCADTATTGPGGISISSCELVDQYCPFTPLFKDDFFTERHPLCEAQDCGCDRANDALCQTNKVGCPDWYEIEIHCGATPDTPIAYKVAHFITEGNFQLHPPVGSTCNPELCGNGTCDTLDGEDCVSCPADCPCQ